MSSTLIDSGVIARRQFDLPEEDVEYLDALGQLWETIVENNVRWLLVHRCTITQGYLSTEDPTSNEMVTQVTTAVQIVAGYPSAELDMAYIYPPLRRANGSTINNLSTQELDGKAFQRWSRHRSGENPWRPGVDSISTHLGLVEEWLARELVRP